MLHDFNFQMDASCLYMSVGSMRFLAGRFHPNTNSLSYITKIHCLMDKGILMANWAKHPFMCAAPTDLLFSAWTCYIHFYFQYLIHFNLTFKMQVRLQDSRVLHDINIKLNFVTIRQCHFSVNCKLNLWYDLVTPTRKFAFWFILLQPEKTGSTEFPSISHLSPDT